MCSYVDVMYNAIEYVYIKIGVSLNKKVSKFQSLLKITTRYVLLKLILDKLFYDFILFHFLLIDSPDHNMCLCTCQYFARPGGGRRAYTGL